jgi:hypothetical protein
VVSRSTDAGATWHRDTLNTSASYTYGLTMAVHPANSNHAYAAGYSGIFYRSTNAGATWTLLNSSLTSYIYDIAPHPTNLNIIYLATSNGVYKTTNAGTAWSDVGLSNVNDVLVHPRGPDTLYAATSAGFYKSTNAGGSWTMNNTGLLDPYITKLAFNAGVPDSSFIFCGTRYGGMSRMFISVIPIAEQEGGSRGFGLAIGPNPARGRVRMSYSLTHPSRVTIAVYDIRGRRVATVVDGRRPAGVNDADWDCRHLANGVYFVKAVTNQAGEVRKLIIVR